MGKMIVQTESRVSTSRQSTAVITGENLNELFRDMVHSAVKTQGAEPSEMAEYYLVTLLSDAVQSSATLTTEKALAEMCFDADGLTPGEREECLRKLGDRALFVSGFYPDSLITKTVSPRYFHKMGSAAYSRLAEELEPHPLFELFSELSRDFKRFVEVLAEVSENIGTRTSREVLATYEKWLLTRSSSAYKRLLKEGINPCTLEAGTIQ